MRRSLVFLLLVACSGDDVATPVRKGSSGAASSSGGEADQDAGRSGTSSSSSGSSSSGSSSSSSGGGEPGKLQAGDRSLSITAGGQARTVLLHVPAAVATQKLPLILALHGNGDQAANFIQTSTLASRTDAIVAAPQGIQRNVSVGGATAPNVAWDAYNSGAGANIDVALLDAVRAELAASGSVDLARVVVFGYSQGGYFAWRYAKEASNDLSCAAVVAAADPGGTPKAFARKLPFMVQIGSGDYAIQNARSSKDALIAAGHEVEYSEIAGAGHSPFPGSKEAPLTFCLGKTR